ncbi:TonB-dependent receptor [Vulcanimicrobium alpinum]|uniref:TonB-dependent receptor n=1 Tax=Vulcanimicrobium alpinum TaxID=3016050 RepID=UPI00295F3A2D|nr:TonB-dependent receptor [Vulcanimicrobium alpinum]
MSKTSSRLVVLLALIAAFLCNGMLAAVAGTTGALSGRVVDVASQAPVAGARVTASAPSGSATQITDANGSFQFLTLQPDTYTLVVSIAGYDSASLSGITVQADQTTTFNVTMAKTLQRIGATRSRATTSLIQPGVSTDVYNISAAQQSAAATLGGGGGLNNAYSAIASVPGVFVPQGQDASYQSIFIRGSNYTQVGYEYDGVPIQRAFDQYPGNNLSSLGQQSVQVYTGSAPTSTGSTALAGFVNQVIRTGTYPGFAGGQLGVGGPTHYANIRLEGGGATPDRNFNYYVGTGGYNQNIVDVRGNLYDAKYGTLLDVYKANCTTPNPTVGCYKNTAAGGAPLGPNGYELGPLFWGSRAYDTDRDTVANFHFGIPHKHDDLRDDVQLLYNTTLVQTYFASAPSDWGPGFQDWINTGAYFGNPPCGGAVTANCNVFGATPESTTTSRSITDSPERSWAPATLRTRSCHSSRARRRIARSTARRIRSNATTTSRTRRSRRCNTNTTSTRVRTSASTGTPSTPTGCSTAKADSTRTSPARSRRITSSARTRAADICSTRTRSTPSTCSS